MKRSTTIALFYTGVAAISLAIIGLAISLRPSLTSTYKGPNVINSGKEIAPQWFPIEKDLSAVNQAGDAVKLSDLRGKVWIAAQFFAICPHCAVRNGEELRKLYDEFGSHPDFHITCISVDPEEDNAEKLGDYAKALNADTKNWWFLNAGDKETTHRYLEEEMKFFGIRERTDPVDIEANGRFAHDMGFLLVDREFKVIGKWPLSDARSEQAKQIDPDMYDKLKNDLYSRIREELEKNESPGI